MALTHHDLVQDTSDPDAPSDAPACSPPTDTAPYPNPPAPPVPRPATPFPARPPSHPRTLKPLAHPPAALLASARPRVQPLVDALAARQRNPAWCDRLGWACTTHVLPAAWGRTTPAVPPPAALECRAGPRKDRVREVAEEVMQAKARQFEMEGAQADERVLWLCVNRYAPKRRREKGTTPLTLFFAHAIGFPKEIWEPTIRLFLARAVDIDIEEIWCIDSVQNGDSALLNDGNLGGLYDWQDNARDILTFLTSYLPPSSSSSLPTFLTPVPAALSTSRLAHGYHPHPRTLLAVGHSFGGCTTALAAHAAPALFAALVLVDPVIIPNGTYHARIVRALVQGAVARREGWASRAEAARMLHASPFFAAWDEEALDVYIECGLVEDPGTGRVRLKMSGVQEAILFTDTRVPAETFEQLSSLPRSVALHWVMPGRPAELGRREMAERVWRRRGKVGSGVVGRASHLIVQECPGELAVVLAGFVGERFGSRVGVRAML